MNNFGTRVAIGYPYFDNWNLGSDGCVKVFDWNGSSWNQVGNNIKSVEVMVGPVQRFL